MAALHWKADQPRPDEARRTHRAAARPKPTPARRPSPPCPRARAQEQQETIAPKNRAAINTFAPSPVAAGVIWAGTNNGVIQLTRDGGATWQDVSPPGLGANYADQHRGSLALRRRHRLRRHRPPRGERFPRPLLPHARFRQDMAGDRRRHSRRLLSPAWCAKIRSARACSMPERKTPLMFPSTKATTGRRCSSTCRSPPCATW